MHPTAKNELKIAIKAYYTRYKDKGKAHTFGVFKNQGLSKLRAELSWMAENREQLIRRIKWVLAKLDRSSIVRMFDNLPEKIKAAHENGLNTVLKYPSRSSEMKFTVINKVYMAKNAKYYRL